ncbi:Ppx/GppA phosphatase family protein [Colwellia psychrerythraea]|uniref:Ppx/GppA phosphatase n=1 Tax=Colwellia psychrerythraea TaxID=28229 RepID=A0A099KR28_COLPS|nr:phosphatase [Colwellia psychrerythraea]KGJ92635.1 Ppx/GppA phosphatase [Colwellia psychrerythraea]
MTNVESQYQQIPQYDENHYAVVDLGSNSFHLLITQVVKTPTGKTIIPVNKVKEKVRLAAGLDSNNILTDEAITSGLTCLSNFALYLKSIPVSNVLIVATAALRIAKNNQIFFDAAKKILPKEIRLLSGEQEAKTIYAGVAHTSSSKSKQLVVDIGGASTEIIVGAGCSATKVVSLDIGCVSFIGKYFADNQLKKESFTECINAATDIINTINDEFIQLGWQSAVGSSGTMQAMMEILSQRQQAPVITLTFLYEIQKILIDCKTIDAIEIAGLRADRKAVLASGLSILIALFQSLSIKELCLSSGALREGLLFELVPDAKIV